MNLRTWTSEHTKGLLLGIATIFVCCLIIVGYFSWDTGNSYAMTFRKFLHLHSFTSRVLSLAAIGNLPWFHFISLKQGKWALGQGLIMATVLDLIIMLLFKFVL